MTESFHESASYEQDRTDDGLIECRYWDGHSITLQIADIVPKTMYDANIAVDYDELVTKDSYVLEPYTTYLTEENDSYGDFELVYSDEQQVVMQAKRHNNSLSYMAIVQTLDPVHGGRLVKTIQNEKSRDMIKQLARIDYFRNLGFGVWVRLEPNKTTKRPIGQPVVAQLASIKVSDDDHTMIPMIIAMDGRIDHVPEQFTLGVPWLYVGVDYNSEPDED
jgi:hypothetical protein